MSSATPAGKLPRLAEREQRVGERQPGDGVIDVAFQMVAAFREAHEDAGAAQQAQVAVEAADIALQAADQGFALLRALAQDLEQAIEVRSTIGGDRLGLLFRAGRAFLGHTVLGAPELRMILSERA